MNLRQMTAIAWAAVLMTLLTHTGQAQDTQTGLVAHWELDDVAIVDSTGNQFNGVNLNDATPGVAGAIGTAYSFDGDDDKLILADFFFDQAYLAGDFSIFMWIKSDATHNQVGGHYLINNYRSGDLGRFGMQVRDGNFGWFNSSSPNPPGAVISTVNVNDNYWHLVGLTRTGAGTDPNPFDYKMWVDTLDVTDDCKGAPNCNDPVDIIGGDGRDWYLGGRETDNNRQYEGVIDDVRVYSRALSSTDIKALPTPLGWHPPSCEFGCDWASPEGGNWDSEGNWSPALMPDSNEHTAKLGGAIQANATVFTDLDRTLANLTFDNGAATYNVAGGGTLHFEGAQVTPAINVMSGSHQIQARAKLLGDTAANVASGSTLTINNVLDLNGNELTKAGPGEIAINNTLGGLSGTSGTFTCAEGTCSGAGTISGNVVNSGGTISPGRSPGLDTSALQTEGSLSVVPEPHTALLMLIALLVSALVDRRQTIPKATGA